MALKRLRQSITLEEKLDIIDRVEAGESRVNVGRDYGYSSSTVGTILSNAAKIRRVARSTCRLNATRLTRTRCVIMERMERMLAVWIEERRRRAAPPGAEDIMAEARRIFDELKARDGGRSEAGTFLASRGWLNRFRRRYNSRCDRERNEDGDDKNSQTILPPTNQPTTRLTTAQVEKRSRVSLTAAMKKELCQYKIDHPSVRLTKLFQIFSKKWEAKVGMTTIRDILREKDKWLSLSEQFEDIKRISGGKYRELEDALFDSFLDARRSNEQINDEWLLVNARKIGRKMNITELQYSNGWLRGFKKRYAINRSRIGGRSSLICSTESKKEILPHTLRSSPKMKHPATFRKHSEVCKLSLRDDVDQMDEYHFMQNRTEEGVVTLQEARTALFKVIAFVSGIPDRDQYLYVLISLLKYFDAYDGHSTYQGGEMKSENVASVNNVDVQCCDDKGTQSVHNEVTAVKEERLSIDGEECDNENVSSKCGSDVLQNGLDCDGGLAVSLNHQQSAGVEPKYARIGVETGIEVMKEEQLSNDGDDGDVYRGENFLGHSVDEGLVTRAGIQQSRAVRKKYGGQTSRMNKMDDCGKCVMFVDESMKYKCDICEKMFMTHDRCKRHVRSVHSGERPFKCSLCGKAFPEKCALTVHTRVHTGEKPFLCTVCGKSFCSSGGQSHMRCHSGEKPFSCLQCDKSFSRASGLKYHARVHSGEKPYKCSACSKAFRSSSELTVHRRRHTGERPYRCFICTASFTKLSICKIHMRKHTGEKPFTCHVCGRAFTQKPLLTNHLRVHTGERPFSCTVCGKKFSQSGSLYHHRKMHKN